MEWLIAYTLVGPGLLLLLPLMDVKRLLLHADLNVDTAQVLVENHYQQLSRNKSLYNADEKQVFVELLSRVKSGIYGPVSQLGTLPQALTNLLELYAEIEEEERVMAYFEEQAAEYL